MASSLAIRRTTLLALPIRANATAGSATAASRAAGYRRLSAAASSIPAAPRQSQHSRILQQCAVGRKEFSTASIRQAEASATKQRMMQDMQRRKATPSIATLQASNLDEMPTDIGLMPDTFVRPTGANLPGLLSEPELRFKMEWHWLKTRAYDVLSRLVYKFTTVKPRPAIGRRGVDKLALRLHKDMYTAFSYGDTNHLASICTSGILNSFRSRISTRKPNERIYWQRLSHSRARIVTDRVVKVPVPGVDSKTKPCCIRQTIFRIKSKQALVRGFVHRKRGGKEFVLDAEGRELPLNADGEVTSERMQQSAKDVKEYLVLQKRLWMGKEEDWFVWGLVDESRPEEIV